MSMFRIGGIAVNVSEGQEETVHVFGSSFLVLLQWRWTWLGPSLQDVTRTWDNQDISW